MAEAQPGVKRKRVLTIRSLETKLAAIRDVEQGTETKGEVARRYNVPPNTLSTWIKNADKIKAASLTADFQPTRKKMRTTPYDDIDKALHGWYVSAKAMGVTFTYKQLQTRAEQIGEEMGYAGFKCSNGWMCRFKQRYNLSLVEGGNSKTAGGDVSGDTSASDVDMSNIDPMYFDTIGEFDSEEELMFDPAAQGHGSPGGVMGSPGGVMGSPEVTVVEEEEEEDEGDRAMRAFRDDGHRHIVQGSHNTHLDHLVSETTMDDNGLDDRLPDHLAPPHPDLNDSFDEPCSIIDIVKADPPDSPEPPKLTREVARGQEVATPAAILPRLNKPGPLCSKIKRKLSRSSSTSSRSSTASPHRGQSRAGSEVKDTKVKVKPCHCGMMSPKVLLLFLKYYVCYHQLM